MKRHIPVIQDDIHYIPRETLYSLKKYLDTRPYGEVVSFRRVIDEASDQYWPISEDNAIEYPTLQSPTSDYLLQKLMHKEINKEEFLTLIDYWYSGVKCLINTSHPSDSLVSHMTDRYLTHVQYQEFLSAFNTVMNTLKPELNAEQQMLVSDFNS